MLCALFLPWITTALILVPITSVTWATSSSSSYSEPLTGSPPGSPGTVPTSMCSGWPESAEVMGMVMVI